jgi:hypothetical protein
MVIAKLDISGCKMLSRSTLDLLDDYWAGFLGIPRERLRAAGPRVVVHAGLGDYAGMYAQSFGGAAPVVSLPAAVTARYGRAAADAAADGLVDDECWRGVFGGALEAVVGPAEIRYADAGTLRPTLSDARARLLDETDRPALERLRRACGETEWEHGGSELARIPWRARSRRASWPPSRDTRCGAGGSRTSRSSPTRRIAGVGWVRWWCSTWRARRWMRGWWRSIARSPPTRRRCGSPIGWGSFPTP